MNILVLISSLMFWIASNMEVHSEPIVEQPIECKYEKIVTHVTLTTYNPVESQCDDTPLITANMTKIDLDKLKSGEQRIVAISRDLLYMIPLGSKVHIEGHGEYIVADVMNKRFTHRMDILQSVGKPNFKKDNVKITYWKYNG